MKILTFAVDIASGVSFYRQIQLMNELKKRGHNIVELPVITSSQECAEKLMKELQDTDFIYIPSPIGMVVFEFIANILTANDDELRLFKSGIPADKMKELGLSTKRIRFIADYDDDLLSVHPFNPAYIDEGRRELNITWDEKVIQIKKGVYEKKQISDSQYVEKVFDPIENKRKARIKIAIMKLASIITTPSKLLARRLKRLSGKNNAFIVPNGVNYSHCERETNDKIRILWTLSQAHYQDWANIRAELGKVLKDNPNVELYTMGQYFGGGNDIPKDQWTYIPWAKGDDAYKRMIKEINPDIGIAYVTDYRFNQFKSPLKWEEYTAIGASVIASKALYSHYLTDKEVCFCEKNTFVNQLTKMINDLPYRNSLTSNSMVELKKYSVEKCADIFESILIKAVNDEHYTLCN